MATTLKLWDDVAGDPAGQGAAHEIVPCGVENIAPADRSFLVLLQRRALDYFLHNQVPSGLILDRQRNHDPIRSDGLCSIAATGMGFIALALATEPPHELLSRQAAAQRILAGLRTAFHCLPHQHGILPHFVDSSSSEVYGADRFSTVDSAWLFAGALWAAEFLGDAELEDLARRVYERVDWRYWAPDGRGQRGLLRHGMGADGRLLRSCWDRLNGETAFMYVLAAGAHEANAMHPQGWQSLRTFHGTVAGLRFNNADLGLFVFQYGLDLLDLGRFRVPDSVDLWQEARVATVANYRSCREIADEFVTYRRYWGLSAGDGPGDRPHRDTYRCYTPLGPIDGTAHITATAAGIAHTPVPVLENLREAQHDRHLVPLGRYGFSNVNADRHWRARDMVGIDAGAAILALENFLNQNRVRRVFHTVPAVQNGLSRMNWTPNTLRRDTGHQTAIRIAS